MEEVMAKGTTRQIGKLSPNRLTSGGGGGGAAVAKCGARVVMLTSSRSLDELRAMGTGDLSVRGNSVIVRRGHAQVGTLTSAVEELRHCIEVERVPFEADLGRARARDDAFEVRVRPGPRR